MLYNHAADFYQMNAGAHRRRATNLNAPALIWHRAFWIDLPYSKELPGVGIDVLENKRRQAHEHCGDRIDDLILELHKFVIEPGNVSDTPQCAVHPVVGDKIFLFRRAVDKGDLTPIDIAKPSSIEQEVLRGDSRVVTISFDWLGISSTVRLEMHTEHFSITIFAELGAAADSMPHYKALEDYLAGIDKRMAENDPRRTEAGQLQQFFFHRFWDGNMRRLARSAPLRAIMADPIFTNTFADFRGLVISDKTHRLGKKIDFGEELSWGRQIDFKLLPLFTENRHYECTASYMLDGRALYMTTLGPQLPEANALQLLPLEYICYVHEGVHEATDRPIVSKWQLGRLIDRIHLLGTVRLASLKYLRELREAGVQLSGLEAHVKHARNDKTGEIDSDGLRKAHEHFANITKNFGAGTYTDTGMLYRIERSRYYVSQFDTNVKTLRIRRLEGYQRYDEFVRHRLGPVFDFINRLGIRYERAMNALSSFDQYSLSLDIRKIQAYGEVVLFGVLVPYYLTSLAEKVVKDTFMVVFTTSIFVVSVGVGAWRFAVFKDYNIFGRIAWFIVGALIAGLIVIALHYSQILKP